MTYQAITQTLLNATALAYGEGMYIGYGPDRKQSYEDILDLVAFLYDKHGPFELTFHTHMDSHQRAMDEWYRGPSGGEDS